MTRLPIVLCLLSLLLFSSPAAQAQLVAIDRHDLTPARFPAVATAIRADLDSPDITIFGPKKQEILYSLATLERLVSDDDGERRTQRRMRALSKQINTALVLHQNSDTDCEHDRKLGSNIARTECRDAMVRTEDERQARTFLLRNDMCSGANCGRPGGP